MPSSLNNQGGVLSVLLNNINEAVIICEALETKTYRIKYVNEFFLQLFGYTRNEVIGQKIDFLINTKHPNTEEKHLLSAFANKKPCVSTINIHRNDGAALTMTLKYAPVVEADGTSVNGLLSFKDESVYTEIDKLSRALDHSSDLLTQYKLAIDEAAIVSKTDPDGFITYVNENFCKTSGYCVDELIGKKHDIVRHASMPNSVFEELWDTILSKQTWRGVVKNKKKNGESYIVDAMIKPILNLESGEIIEFISIRHDITNEVNAKMAAQKALAQKSDFFANVSHELRTPLNVVINFSEDILEDFDEIATSEDVRGESKHMLQKVIKSAKHLLSIINDILDISKLGSKNNQLHLEDESLNQILFEIYESLKASTHKGVVMELVACDETVIAKTHIRYLKQILINLLSNAIKFTDAGKIVMSLKYLDGFAIIEVMDSGRGIAKEKMDIIFEPFVQVNSFDEGTGLGLRLVKDMCAKLHIDLHIESELGVGTLFYLKLKLTKIEPTKQMESPNAR